MSDHRLSTLVICPPPFFRRGLGSLCLLLLLVLGIPTGALAQGDESTWLDSHQNLITGSSQIDRPESLQIHNGNAIRPASRHPGRGGSDYVPLEDDGNRTDAVTNIRKTGIYAHIGSNVDPPGPPTNLVAKGGRTNIKLSWTAPSDDGGSVIVGYRIEWSSSGQNNDWHTLATIIGRDKTDYTHPSRTAGTTDYYRVRAVNHDDGAGNPSNVASATAGTPGAVTGVAATASGRNQINLSWRAPSENGGASVTGYSIQVSPNGTGNWTDLVENTNSTAVTYPHENLSPGTTRYYRVYAINSRGVGTFDSNVATATTDPITAPTAPTGLTATASGSNQINLSWTTPSDNGGEILRGYAIEVSTNAGTSWTYLVGGTGSLATTYEDMGLTAGETRHYRVYANTRNYQSVPSNVAHATTDARAAPDAPTGLTATASGPTQINLSWTAPSNNGNTAITGYKIEVSANAGTSWSDLVENTGSSATTYEDMGLTAGETRHYRVSAINSDGESDPSNVANATTPATITRPGAPTNLTATAMGMNQIDLSWTTPSNDGGASITGYRIQVSPNGTGNWTNLVGNTNTPNTTRYEHTSLSPGTTRHYRVRAINSEGAGNPSNVDHATTDASTVIRPGAPTNLMATPSGPTRINLSWTAPSNNGGAAITGYQIEVSANAGTSWNDLMANTGSSATTYPHTGLSEGTTRHYRVSAINSTGTGTPSNVASATTQSVRAPDAPTGLTARASGSTEIILSWKAPSNNGGSTITGYRIEVSTDAETSWSDQDADTGSAATTYTDSGLTEGTTRHYRVSAINSAGTGTPSSVASATTGGTTAPSAPTGLTATAAGPTQINLSWSAPSENGGAAITGYQIEVSTDAGAFWNDLVTNTGSTATTDTHMGLAPETRYDYRIRAINAVGTGSPSNIDYATTAAATVPDAPTELTATVSGPMKITLSWISPSNNGGAAITGYRIQVSADAGEIWSDLEEDTGSTATTYTHTGLDEGTTRHYRVYAINSVGKSTAPSSVANVVISAPDAPTELTATPLGQTEIKLFWAKPSGSGVSISGYHIEVSADAGETWSDLVTNTERTDTTYTHTGLLPETTRHYRVRALNPLGTSDPSNVAHATTGMPLRPPGVPTNIQVFAEGQEAVNLSWSAPMDDGGSPIIAYRIEMSEDTGVTWEMVAEVTTMTYRHAFPPSGPTRFYRILARNAVGLGVPSMAIHVSPDPTTSIESSGDEIPTDFSLEQNYPNPFNPSTAIEFSLTSTGQVTLTVYDLLGQKVQTLIDGVQPAGRHSVLFTGAGLASDTYLYVLQTEDQRAVKMMTLLK